MVLDDLNNAPLSQEGGSVFNDDYLWLQAQDAQQGNLFVQLTVDSSLDALDSRLQTVLAIVLKVFFDFELFSEEVGLKLVEVVNIPGNVFL